MDNAINKVVTDAVLGQLDSLIDKVLKADEALIKASQSANAFSKTMGTPPKTSDALNKQLQDSQRLIQQLQADYKRQEAALASLQSKYQSLANAKKSVNATDRQTIIDNREIRKELDGQAIANSNLTSYIQKLSVERAKASRIVADYNAQVAMGTALTEEQSAELVQATAAFQKYDAAIKAGKASIGDAREYVGQYERANLGLVNSVNQIVREVPSATFGIQTFFLAISNNVPIMVDEINRAVQANKELAKSGEPITSVWKQVSSAIFSFNTLMNVSLLILALYGKEIGKAVSEMLNFSSALDEANAKQEEFNKTKIEGRKDAQTDIIELRKYLAVVKDTNVNEELRQIALKKLREEYPYYFKNLTDAQILLGQTSEAEKQLTIDLEKRKEVEKATSLNVENKQKLIDLQNELDLQLKLKKEAQDNISISSKRGDSAKTLAFYSDNLRQAEQKRIKIQTEIDAITKNSIANDEIIFQLKKETIALEYTETKATEENTRAIKLNTKAREDYLASEYELWRLRKQNESNANKDIMEDEKMGFELRALASQQFYENEAELAQRAQQEQIRVLDLATEDKLRINENEFLNYQDSLKKQLKSSELTADQKNAIEKELSDSFNQYQKDKVGIEKDAENQRLIINENYIQKYLDINKEMVGKLKAMYNELELAKKDFQISEEDLKATKEINALLQDITPEMSIEEIEGSLNQISKINERTNLDINQKEKELHLERLKRLKEQVEGEIVLQLVRQGKSDDEIQMALRNNKYLINLGKQILDAEKDVQDAKNAIHNQDIKNILDEKKVWKEVNDSIYESRLQLFEKLADLANMGFENVISYYDREIERSNDYYDSLLENAENGSEQEQMLQEEKERKAEQLRKRRVDAERKQAIFNKVLSVGQVVIETSKAIAAINATAAKYDFLVPGSGQAYRASQIPLVLGSAAVQTGIIMATPLPQYKDGRGKGKDEFAVVGDGGRSEVIQRGNGRIEVTPSVPTITHLGKDDIVHKSLDDFERSRLAIQNASIMASFGSQSRQLQMFDYYLGRELHGISNKIEKGIEKGFKKAKIYNNVKMPNIDIGHIHYKNSGLT
jgi:hypothetical protein